jgi:hypothetical protein
MLMRSFFVVVRAEMQKKGILSVPSSVQTVTKEKEFAVTKEKELARAPTGQSSKVSMASALLETGMPPAKDSKQETPPAKYNSQPKPQSEQLTKVKPVHGKPKNDDEMNDQARKRARTTSPQRTTQTPTQPPVQASSLPPLSQWSSQDICACTFFAYCAHSLCFFLHDISLPLHLFVWSLVLAFFFFLDQGCYVLVLPTRLTNRCSQAKRSMVPCFVVGIKVNRRKKSSNH